MFFLIINSLCFHHQIIMNHTHHEWETKQKAKFKTIIIKAKNR